VLTVETISIDELKAMSSRMYEPLVKGVVDVARGLLVVDAEMHADEEQFLLEAGSAQGDLWGINLWPEKFGTEGFVEFDSIINIRPRQNNRSRSIDDASLRARILALVEEKVHG